MICLPMSLPRMSLSYVLNFPCARVMSATFLNSNRLSNQLSTILGQSHPSSVPSPPKLGGSPLNSHVYSCKELRTVPCLNPPAKTCTTHFDNTEPLSQLPHTQCILNPHNNSHSPLPEPPKISLQRYSFDPTISLSKCTLSFSYYNNHLNFRCAKFAPKFTSTEIKK